MYHKILLPLGAIWLLALYPLAAEEPEQPTPFRAVAFSGDGKLLAAGFGERAVPGGLVLWNVADQRAVRQLQTAVGVSTLAFSPDGQLLAFTQYDQPPRVLDVATGEVIWELVEPCRGGVAFSPDGKLLACSGTDKGIYLFDVERRKESKVIEGADERAAGRMCFSRDGTLLLTPCGSAGVYLWDLAAGKALQQFKHGQSYVRSAEFSPDGEWIVTCGYDATARIWNAKTGEFRARLSRVGGSALAISPDGKMLAITSEKTISLFELWLSPPRAEDITLAQERLAALESDSYAKRQSASEGLAALGFRAESILQHAADHSPDAEVRIRARLARQRILSEPTAVLRGNKSDVSAVCISPDSRTIATASDDGTVRLWDASSFQQIALFRIQ